MAVPRRPILVDRLAASLVLLAVATAAMACAASPGPAGTAAADVLGALPQPPLATLVVGAGGPGVDGDSRFIAFTSEASLAPERANYDLALRAAGYTVVSTAGDWTAYQRAGTTVWISVTANGPQTSIIALVGSDPGSSATPVAVAVNPAATLPVGDVVTPHPATPEPATGPTSHPTPTGSRAPALSPSPSSSPQPSHGKPSDTPSHPPKATPIPTTSPTPTLTHKPKPTPKPTHNPKSSQASAVGGAAP